MFKKFTFFLIILSGFFLPFHKSFAMTKAECTSQLGTCNSWYSTCGSGYTLLGVCDGTMYNTGCCKADGAEQVNAGSKYTPLEKVPFINGTDFQSYVAGLYTLGLVIIVLSAVFMLVIGGFMYLTSAGNTSALSSAKHVIQGALFGLILALVSYLLLKTINPELVNLRVSTFQPVATNGTSGSTNNSGSNSSGSTSGGSFSAKQSSDTYTDAQARAALSAAGISVNKADCTSPTQTNCTSLGEIPKSAINFAIALKRDCNCNLVITGGTEAGHTTHGKGKAALDISRDISGFISRQSILTVSKGRPVYSYGGFRVWDEDSAHFHAWEPSN